MNASERVRAAGFPRVAELLDMGLCVQARNQLRRFEPSSMAEADAKRRALAAMPEVECDDVDDG